MIYFDGGYTCLSFGEGGTLTFVFNAKNTCVQKTIKVIDLQIIL